MNRIAVRRELRRKIGLYGLKRVIGVRLHDGGKGPIGPIQQLAAALQRFQRVGESRLFRIAGNGLDLVELLAHAFLEGLPIVGILDPVERRRLVGQRARRKQRVGGSAPGIRGAFGGHAGLRTLFRRRGILRRLRTAAQAEHDCQTGHSKSLHGIRPFAQGSE
jgi:hypothetical protein